MDLVDRSIIQQKYDRYVEFYNESDNPITAYSELLTIKEGLQQRLQEINEKVDLLIDDIKYYLSEIYDRTLSDEKDVAENLLTSNHEKLVENIIEQVHWEVDSFFHISHPRDFINQNYQQILEVFKANDQDGQEQKTKRTLKSITSYGEEYEQVYYHLRGVRAVANKIINEDYPTTELKDYRDLNEQEKQEIAEDYTPHHNTREGLIEDLQKIIKEIRTQSRFFHKDGTIKHTTVAEYAVSQKWFAEKHGYGDRGLHEHIKKTYQSMKSSYSS
jgi:hypothetical protein